MWGPLSISSYNIFMIKKYADYIDDAFYFGIILKAVGGAAELASAAVIGLISLGTFENWIKPLERLGFHTTEELAGGAKQYVFFYLLSHGLIRVGLAYCLLKEYLWAYPLALLVLGGFIVYQIILLIQGFSIGLLGLMLFNFVILGLTFYEWRKLRAGGHLHRPHL